MSYRKGTKVVGNKKREGLNNPLLPPPETFLLIVAKFMVNCKTTKSQKNSEISAKVVLYMLIFL